MKKLPFLLFIFLTVFFESCSDSSRDSETAVQPQPITYEKALNNLGIQLNTNYSYKSVLNSDVGQIKFNTNQTVTETFNGTTVTFEYKFESNNQTGNDFTVTLTAIDKSSIPSYNPKLPVTSLAKNYNFQVQKRNYNGTIKTQIGGMYSVSDPSEYWKIVLQ